MGRSPCCDGNDLKKGSWTSEEDQKLIQFIQNHGHGSWKTLPKLAGPLSIYSINVCIYTEDKCVLLVQDSIDVARAAGFDGLTTYDQISREESCPQKKRTPFFISIPSMATGTTSAPQPCLRSPGFQTSNVWLASFFLFP